MRTAHLLTISQHALLGGTCPGVYLPGVYLPGWCTCPGGVPVQGGTSPGTPPPPVNRMTDRCKNITLPQTSFAGGKHYLPATTVVGGNKAASFPCGHSFGRPSPVLRSHQKRFSAVSNVITEKDGKIFVFTQCKWALKVGIWLLDTLMFAIPTHFHKAKRARGKYQLKRSLPCHLLRYL